MKTAIMQVFVPLTPWYRHNADTILKCAATFEHYAKRISADYYLFTKPVPSIPTGPSYKPYYMLAADVLDQYDFVYCTDVDSIVGDQAPNIFDWVDPAYAVHGSYNSTHPWGDGVVRELGVDVSNWPKDNNDHLIWLGGVNNIWSRTARLRAKPHVSLCYSNMHEDEGAWNLIRYHAQLNVNPNVSLQELPFYSRGFPTIGRARMYTFHRDNKDEIAHSLKMQRSL